MWSLIIFLMLKGLVSTGFGSHIPTGGCGGAFSPTIVAGVEESDVRAPPSGGSGAVPPKGFFYEKCLVKYCNFVVNMDHSLCHIYDRRIYVNLRVFCLKSQPSIIFEGIVL